MNGIIRTMQGHVDPQTGAGSTATAMTVPEAQRDVRLAFIGGSAGQFVSGAIWLTSAALSTFVGEREGILALFIGGMFIYPLTVLLLKLLGHSGTLARHNPLRWMPLQSVFAMTAMFPLVYVATLHNLNWFYPAFMLVVGAHYISFIPLYGMPHYAVLAATLIGAGLALVLLTPNGFSVGGWVTGLVLALFALFVFRVGKYRVNASEASE
jgi:hypothetical protein